nr:MAG TPA: type I neck protein [Caudoviricetes sp.]
MGRGIVTHKGSFAKTERFLNFVKGERYLNRLAEFGQRGVDALAQATPKETGKTAGSWAFEIERTDTATTIRWVNTNVVQHVNIALILQYGHGTRNGGYVAGRDYINPALQPIFDEMAEQAWKEVRNA